MPRGLQGEGQGRQAPWGRGGTATSYPSRESSPSTAEPSIRHCASVVSGSFFCKGSPPAPSGSPRSQDVTLSPGPGGYGHPAPPAVTQLCFCTCALPRTSLTRVLYSHVYNPSAPRTHARAPACAWLKERRKRLRCPLGIPRGAWRTSPSACRRPRLAGPADMPSASCGCCGRPASPAPDASPPADTAAPVTVPSLLILTLVRTYPFVNQRDFNCRCVGLGTDSWLSSTTLLCQAEGQWPWGQAWGQQQCWDNAARCGQARAGAFSPQESFACTKLADTQPQG